MWSLFSIIVAGTAIVLILMKIGHILMRIPSVGDLSDRYILITGCDSGFGCLVAKKLNSLGCNVFAGCLTDQGQADLRTQSLGRIKTFHLDVTREDSIRRAFEYVKSNLPAGKGLWALLTNAGIAGSSCPLEWHSMRDIRDVCDVNLFGMIDVTCTFLPLVKLEKGRIVNMASILGRIIKPRSTVYCVSKYGVEAFSDGIRLELRPYNISVHIIEPGLFNTNLTNPVNMERRVRDMWGRLAPEIQEEYGLEYLDQVLNNYSRGILGRSDKLENVVDAYVHAVTAVFPRSRYVVGNDAQFFYLPLSLLPSRISELFIRAVSNKPIPAACKEQQSFTN